MERKEIKEKIDSIIVDTLGITQDSVREEADLREDYGCDSLDCLDIIMNTEKEFSIAIADDDAVNCNTVGDVYDLVEKILNGNA